MENTPIWMMNLPPGSIHQGAHKTNVITQNPHGYSENGWGTVIPHVFGGGNGGGTGVPNQVEGSTGDGSSPAVAPVAARVFVDAYENPVTGEGASAVIEQGAISKEAVDAAMASSEDVSERMAKLGEITHSDLTPKEGIPWRENLAQVEQALAAQPQANPDYVFEQMLRQPVQSSYNIPQFSVASPQQPGIPEALVSYMQQQTAIMQKLMADRAPAPEPTKKRWSEDDVRFPSELKKEASEGEVGHVTNYGRIGLPWVKDPPEAPSVTVVFSFGRMTHKARFHDVSVRKCGAHRCLYLAVDERYEGSMTFPDPSDEPFRVTVPEKDIDLIVYDADIRLDCGGKLTFIVLLEAGGEDQYAG